ncbi:DUF4179 domain-containing protein [Paenibacillus fonticola]|uniref:DUF4179 domain-containing protein n=1 Tax=Paenibacillus fonticola TaxID=379896 RepID=UPI0003661271|nr:DUF4179 domain-containing protein [Paenibacillus fonticola]
MQEKPNYRREEALLADYYKPYQAAAENIDEQRLENAIITGISAGQIRKQRLIRYRPWKFAGALLACCLILIAGWQLWELELKENAMFHAYRADIPDYAYNRMTSTLKEAAHHGLYQPINKTVTQGDYEVTLNGVIADRSTVVVFYTSVNLPGNTPIYASDVKLFDQQGTRLNVDIQHSATEPEPGTSTNVQHGEFTFTALDFTALEGSIPDKLSLTANWGHRQASNELHELIKIPFQIDSSKYAGLEQRIEVNKSAAISDYTFTITEAILNPLTSRIYLQIDGPEENLYQYLIRPVLLTSRNGSIHSLPVQMSMTGPDHLMMQFDSISFSDWDELAFGASGMAEALGPDLKLVLDTEKQDVLSSPDSRVRLMRIIQNEEYIDLHFEMDLDDDDRRFLRFELDEMFTDGSGGQHSLILGRSSSSSGSIETISYKIKPDNYIQPLTFNIRNYPGRKFNQPIHISLQSKLVSGD